MNKFGKKAAVVVLGGGVIGFSIAYHLARERIPCQVIEMDSIGARASGASMGNISSAAGAVLYLGSWSQTEVQKTSVSLEAETYNRLKQLHLELKEETGLDIRYGAQGGLFCALSEEEEKVVRGLVSKVKDGGYEATWLSGDEIRAEDNLISTEVRGAALVDYAQVDAYRYTLALAQAAEKLGSNIRLAEVVGFRSNKNKVTSVILRRGEVATDTVVIAMGPWSRQAGSWLGVEIPLKVVRGQAVKLLGLNHPRRRAGFTPPHSEWPGKGTGRLHISVVPRVDGSVLAGYSEDWPATWDNNNPGTWEDISTQEMKVAMVEGAVRLFPALENALVVEDLHGLLGYAPDEMPIIGSLPGWDNVYVAAGLGTTGVTMSTATGRLVTELIGGGEQAKKAAEETKALSPSRFR